MLSKNVLLIVPGDGKQRSRKILLPSLIRILFPLGILGLTFIFGVIITDNMYQRQCIRQQQPQVSYVSEIEKQLADKEGEISALKGQLENINDNIDTITDLQNKIVSMLDEEGVPVAALSPAQQETASVPSDESAADTEKINNNPSTDKSASKHSLPAKEYTPVEINKAITSNKVHSLDEAYEQTQIYLSSTESYYDDILAAYEIKQLHTPNILPLNGEISSYFGNRKDPFNPNIVEFHNGVDFMVPTGTMVNAPADGIIVTAAYEGGWGNLIRIDHGYGIITFYAHLSQINVKVGQKIKRGENIGYSGNTGRSTGSHLHYGSMLNNQPVDPLTFLSPANITVSNNNKT